MENLHRLYALIGERQKELGNYFSIVENEYYDKQIEVFIDHFLTQIELSLIKENRVALLSRLINLRDEQMVQALEKEEKDSVFIMQAKEKAYLWVKEFYLKEHEALLDKIEQEKLLSPFYQSLLRGVHRVGIALSTWQSSWTEHIINTINPLLELEYHNDAKAIATMLHEKGLYDKDIYGQDADRSYSVLFKIPQGYEAKAYALAFTNEVQEVVQALEDMIEKLQCLEDDDWGQKKSYIAYFQALCKAFGEKDRAKLIARWEEVDRCWMHITSPIQVGHPLEYYEDHYKKAVALEWDVRIAHPHNLNAAHTAHRIKEMFETLFEEAKNTHQTLKQEVLSNLKRVQLYIGRPALFYAAEFNGLFSAQVVPNDEVITQEMGKKIFAFADNILDSLRAKPFLKIHHEVFGKDFMDKERELIFHQPDIWHQVYDITTIGHEFGHILWMDQESETSMNRSGVFKNIEEFKATTGGLVAFFMQEDSALKNYVFTDIIKRAIGLIAWMKTAEVEPYYCEGLIHLSGLFESKVLVFDQRLSIDTSVQAYERLKTWYVRVYKELVQHYVDKKDAALFLERFAIKKEGIYEPASLDVKEFVAYYWALHQRIGREIDESVKRQEWL